MDWTEEQTELLKKLWMEGLSASQIGGILGEGATRNAVIGKVHRLKLSGRVKPSTSAPRARSAPSPRRQVALPGQRARTPPGGSHKSSEAHTRAMLNVQKEEIYEAPVVPELFIPIENRLSINQLGENTCKWPIGDPLQPDFYFCGQFSEKGKSYCEFHARRSYRPISKKSR